MIEPSGVLKTLLQDIRQHPAFPELLKIIPAPQIPRFRASQAEQVESERSKWIYKSGQRDQHDMWIRLLTGEVPDKRDD